MEEIIKKSKRDSSWGIFNTEFLILSGVFLLFLIWIIGIPIIILYLTFSFSKWFLLLFIVYVYLTYMIFKAFKY